MAILLAVILALVGIISSPLYPVLLFPATVVIIPEAFGNSTSGVGAGVNDCPPFLIL